MINSKIIIFCIGILLSINAFANEVEIVKAKLQRDSDDTWTLSVTLLHADNGWDHYADKWRVSDSNGVELGKRILAHPHDNEQPFERSASGIKVPAGEHTLYIEAHDTVHGWNDKKLKLDLTKLSKRGRLTVSNDSLE